MDWRTVWRSTRQRWAGANCGSCLDMAMDVLQAAQPAPRESVFPIIGLSHAA